MLHMYENVQSLERSLFAYPMIDVVSHMFIVDHGKIFIQSPTHMHTRIMAVVESKTKQISR